MIFPLWRPNVDGHFWLEEWVVHHGGCRAQLCGVWCPHAAFGSHQEEAKEEDLLRPTGELYTTGLPQTVLVYVSGSSS